LFLYIVTMIATAIIITTTTMSTVASLFDISDMIVAHASTTCR
jgi:hypothetical protein